jgi:hypothetical protein
LINKQGFDAEAIAKILAEQKEKYKKWREGVQEEDAIPYVCLVCFILYNSVYISYVFASDYHCPF